MFPFSVVADSLSNFSSLDKYNMLGTKENEIMSWNSMRSEIRQMENGEWSEISAEEEKRFRYFRRMVVDEGSPFYVLGPKWGPSFTLYVDCMSKTLHKEFVRVLRRAGIMSLRGDEAVAAGLKLLSDHSKKFGKVFSKYWKYFVNLELFGGYRTVSDDSFVEDIREWVVGDVSHYSYDGSSWNEETFNRDFDEGVGDFVAKTFTKPGHTPEPLADWVGDVANWATSGSTQLRKPILYGKATSPKKAGWTKWTSALATDSKTLLHMLRKKGAQKNKAIKKREAGKVRAVVSSDDILYLKMAYVSSWLEGKASGATSTLFMNTNEVQDMWKKVQDSCSKESWKIPLDQSKFDHQVNRRMLGICIERIKRLAQATLPDGESKADIMMCLDHIHFALVEDPGSVEVRDGAKVFKFPVEHGVMSGWRWTALLDTMVNWAEYYTSQCIIKRFGFTDTTVNLVAQGDDDRVETRLLSSAVATVGAYAGMELAINPGKFFIDTDRDEYLRLVAVKGEVSGYPARSILNILWRNPVSVEEPKGILRANEQVEQWDSLYSRGMVFERVLYHMTKDIAGAAGLSEEVVTSVLQTPKALGGLGYLPWGGQVVEYSPGRAEREVKWLSKFPGLEYTKNAWALAGISGLTFTDVLANVPTPQSKIELVPGSISLGKPVVPIDFNGPWVNQGGWKTGMIVNEDLPLTGRSDVVNDLVDKADWQGLEQICSDEQRGEFLKIKSNVTRRIFVKWCLGKLDIGNFRVPGVNPIACANVKNSSSNNMWFNFVCKNASKDKNVTLLTRMRLGLELAERDRIRSMNWHYGR